LEDNFSDDVELLHRTIRYNIKKLREAKNMSQMDIRHSIGHSSAGFYGKAEIGIQNKKFNIEHLVKIAKVLECDICEFFKPINKDDEPSSEI